MGKTALVTGASGFVGRHFVAHLEQQGWEVDPRDVATGWADSVEHLTDYGRLYRRYDLVIHAAARSAHRVGIDTDHGAGPYNAMLDAAMIEWVIRTSQPRFVYLSSCAVYSRRAPYPPGWREELGTYNVPDDIYGAVKRAGERLCQQATAAGVGVTIVRPFSGYGEDQGLNWPFRAFLSRVLFRAARPDTVGSIEVWGSGRQVRDWIHIDDIVAGTMALVQAGVAGPVNLCTGRGVRMIELLQMMMDAAGLPKTVEINTRRDRPEGALYRVGDPSELLRYYTPVVSLEEGVARALGRSSSESGT